MTDGCADVSFVEVRAAGERWQRWLVRQWRGAIPDIEAEIAACVWEQFRVGVTDQAVLFSAARTAVRRVARREAAAFRAQTAAVCRFRPVGEDPFDRIVDRVSAAEVVGRLPIPARSRNWVQVMSVGGAATPQAMEAGRRWANRVRDDMRFDPCR